MKSVYSAMMVAISMWTVMSGCGRQLHPVEGKLVWEDGQPAKELAGSMIYFESTEHRTVSRSVVNDDGQFQLTTERPEANGADGVPPGKHRVYIVDGIPSLMQPRFRRPDTSGLEVTVPPESPVQLQIARAPLRGSNAQAPTRDDER